MHQPRGLHEVRRRRFAVAGLQLQHALLQGQPRVRRKQLHHRLASQAAQQLLRALAIGRLNRETEALEPPYRQRRQQEEHAETREHQSDTQRRPRH